MTDEPEAQEGLGAAHRTRPEASLANLKPPWKPGESGNPTGRTKGYQLPAKRLQNLIGGEAGWGEMEPQIREIMRGVAAKTIPEVEARNQLLRLLGLALQNDHALLKARDPDDTSQHEQAAGFVVRPPEDEGKVTDDGEPSE